MVKRYLPKSNSKHRRLSFSLSNLRCNYIQILGTYEIEFFARIVCLIYPLWIFIIYFRLKNLIFQHRNILYATFLISLLLIFYIFRHYALFIGYVDPILFHNYFIRYLHILMKDKELKFIDF